MTDIHDHIRELTRTHIAQAEYTTELGTRWHYTTHPPLLQMLQANQPTGSGDNNTSGGGAKSQPPTHIEALDTLRHIDQMASAWVRHLGHDDPSTTIACVVKLGSLYPSAGERNQPRIARDVKSWWTQTRVVTGIDSPSWRPNNTCPLCATRGGLRVNRDTLEGACIGCREVWTPDTMGLLADHIRSENSDLDDALPEAG